LPPGPTVSAGVLFSDAVVVVRAAVAPHDGNYNNMQSTAYTPHRTAFHLNSWLNTLGRNNEHSLLLMLPQVLSHPWYFVI